MKKKLLINSISYAVLGLSLTYFDVAYSQNYQNPSSSYSQAPGAYGNQNYNSSYNPSYSQSQNYGSSYQGTNSYNSNYSQNPGFQGSSNRYSQESNYSSQNYNRQNTNNPAVSDQELNKRIKGKIGSGWFSRGYEQVNAQVNNGTVTLQGVVETWSDKENIEKDIRNLDGVKSLNSQLRVQEQKQASSDKNQFPQDRASSPTDDQLNKKIRDNISKGWLTNSYKDISLSTSNGVVTLQGLIDDREDQQDLINDIQKIEGVRYVNSNLKFRDAK